MGNYPTTADEIGYNRERRIDMTIIEQIEEANKRHTKVSMDVVWGDAADGGLTVARQHQTCPIWHDTVQYKASTIVCEYDDEILEDVLYWLEYVYGCDCVIDYKKLADNKIAIRAQYQCW